MFSIFHVAGVALLLTTTWAKTCYTPAGSKRNAQYNVSEGVLYAPCDNTAGVVSMCCAIGPGRGSTPDYCRRDGFCDNPDVTGVWRESCTDPTWQDPACKKLFLNGTGYQGGQLDQVDDQPLTDVLISICDNGSYCYGTNNRACCQQGQGVFLDTQGQQTNQNPAASTSTSSISSSPTPTSTQSTISNPDASSGGLSTGAKAGIGVGVAVVVILVIAVVAFIFFRRKRPARGPYTKAPQTEYFARAAAEKHTSGTTWSEPQSFHEMQGGPYGFYQPVKQQHQMQPPIELQ